MKVTSNIKLNISKLMGLDAAQKKALGMTIDALKTEVTNAGVVPFKIGTLQDAETKVTDNKASLIYSTLYARRLYYHPEYNFNRAKNRNAQGKWLEPWISGENKDFCTKTYGQFLKKGGKL